MYFLGTAGTKREAEKKAAYWRKRGAKGVRITKGTVKKMRGGRLVKAVEYNIWTTSAKI